MFDTTISECAGRLVDPRNVETLEVLGVQFLTPPRDGDPCVMRGTVPLGITVPLHSQPDPETFIQVPGEIEGLSQSPEGLSGYPSGRTIFSMCRAGRSTPFEICRPRRQSCPRQHLKDRPVLPGSRRADRWGKPGIRILPSADAIQYFLKTSAAYGYWNATPEENACVGHSVTLR
jgi:hypothetical protein